MTLHRVFVYGTLKEGFRNAHVNGGRRVPGDFVTVKAFPLYVIGPFALPWLVNEPGRGHRIRGQLFEVDDEVLAAMDVLERVNDDHWYTRRELEVAPLPGGHAVRALAYFGSAVRITEEPIHHGPLDQYTEVHQLLYRRHV